MADWQYQLVPHTLVFSFDAHTSRGALTQRPTWFLLLKHPHLKGIGIGELGIIPCLSPEDRPDALEVIAQQLNQLMELLPEPSFLRILSLRDRALWLLRNMDASLPAVRFAVECAILDLLQGGAQQPLWNNAFTEGTVPIITNGLIWMGTMEEMERQVVDKIIRGYRTLKLKISADGWDKERELIKKIRRLHGNVTLRVDANGSFSMREARNILTDLLDLGVHSIEQPIKAGKWDQMASLCKNHPMPIALDEELIGVTEPDDMVRLLETIQPQYLVLKPSLLGGFGAVQNWIVQANKYKISWWVTSALESNIGLNYIAQFVSSTGNAMVHGLGTGQLYTNNIGPSPLELRGEELYYKPEVKFNLDKLQWATGAPSGFVHEEVAAV